jgi:beta-glucosidase
MEVQNTGHAHGADVIQLYVSFPKAAGERPKILRGLKNVFINIVHQSKSIKFGLTKTEPSIWDVASQSWIIPRGQLQSHVGASSRDIRQSATFIL